MLHRKSVAAVAIFISLGISALNLQNTPRLDWRFQVKKPDVSANAQPKFRMIFDYHSPDGEAHSPAIRPLDQTFAIMWFDGTRESHDDVVIKQSLFSNENGSWTAESHSTLFTKEEISKVSIPRQTVWTLGNTIQDNADPNVLYSTIVSVGGWAASSIARITFQDTKPSKMEKLSLSPFLNRSQLVRSPTVAYQDGTQAIPAYLELGNALGEWVRLDKDGKVRDKRRMSQGRFAIQPVIIPFSDFEAIALLRNFDHPTRRIVMTKTQDGGRTWQEPILLELPNPDAPIAATLLSNETVLIAFNDAAYNPGILRLAISKDRGQSWTRIHTLEDHEAGSGMDARYPAFHRLPNNDIILTYSHSSKKGIRAFALNEAWVHNKIEQLE